MAPPSAQIAYPERFGAPVRKHVATFRHMFQNNNKVQARVDLSSPANPLAKRACATLAKALQACLTGMAAVAARSTDEPVSDLTPSGMAHFIHPYGPSRDTVIVAARVRLHPAISKLIDELAENSPGKADCITVPWGADGTMSLQVTWEYRPMPRELRIEGLPAFVCADALQEMLSAAGYETTAIHPCPFECEGYVCEDMPQAGAFDVTFSVDSAAPPGTLVMKGYESSVIRVYRPSSLIAAPAPELGDLKLPPAAASSYAGAARQGNKPGKGAGGKPGKGSGSKPGKNASGKPAAPGDKGRRQGAPAGKNPQAPQQDNSRREEKTPGHSPAANAAFESAMEQLRRKVTHEAAKKAAEAAGVPPPPPHVPHPDAAVADAVEQLLISKEQKVAAVAEVKAAEVKTAELSATLSTLVARADAKERAQKHPNCTFCNSPGHAAEDCPERGHSFNDVDMEDIPPADAEAGTAGGGDRLPPQ